jgi:hypothetical protein
MEMLKCSGLSRMLKKSAILGKVKAKVEVKMKKVRSSLNLNLSLPQILRPSWTP